MGTVLSVIIKGVILVIVSVWHVWGHCINLDYMIREGVLCVYVFALLIVFVKLLFSCTPLLATQLPFLNKLAGL